MSASAEALSAPTPCSISRKTRSPPSSTHFSPSLWLLTPPPTYTIGLSLPSGPPTGPLSCGRPWCSAVDDIPRQLGHVCGSFGGSHHPDWPGRGPWVGSPCTCARPGPSPKRAALLPNVHQSLPCGQHRVPMSSPTPNRSTAASPELLQPRPHGPTEAWAPHLQRRPPASCPPRSRSASGSATGTSLRLLRAPAPAESCPLPHVSAPTGPCAVTPPPSRQRTEQRGPATLGGEGTPRAPKHSKRSHCS